MDLYGVLFDMDKNEFNALGQLIFGTYWKKELTRSLGLSDKSRTVDKISLNQRVLSKNIQNDLMNLLANKIQLLSDARAFFGQTKEGGYEQIYKLMVIPCDKCSLMFSDNGISEITDENKHILPLIPKDDQSIIYIENVKIEALDSACARSSFQSLVVSSIFNDISIFNKRKAVAKTLLKYYDWTQCSQHEKYLISLAL